MSTPSSLSTVISRTDPAGPVVVDVESDHAPALHKVNALLSQYDVPWSFPSCALSVRITTAGEPHGEPPHLHRGNYLQCVRFSVDRCGADYRGQTRTGLRFHFSDDTSALHLTMAATLPTGETELEALEEVEQLVTFALTRCWRRLGWSPLHAGSVCTAGASACALLCTHAGGGKSTLVAALLRRGFKTLGDDKTLIRVEAGTTPLAVSLARDTNLHPRSARWFPEVGDLSAMPTYSHWTDKRKLRIQEVWPGCMILAARPTHILRIDRAAGTGPISVAPMGRTETLDALMRQVVIPTDREHARETIRVLTALAETCAGHAVTIPDHAYDHQHATAPVEDLLR